MAVDSLSSASSTLNSLMTLFLRIGAIAVGIVAIVGGVLYAKQDSLLYFPEISGIPKKPSDNPRGYRSPQERHMAFRDVDIECEDGVHIHAWLLIYSGDHLQHNETAQLDPKIPTILFFHGNAGNIGLRLPNADQMVRYLKANVLLVEYRGYGHSDSVTPSEKGLRLDAEAAWKWCLQQPDINHQQLFVFGRSLGGAVGFHLAYHAQKQHQPLAGIMVENTFTSISDMVDHLMPFVAPLKSLILTINWNSMKIVPHLTCPILFLAGNKDEIVPHAHMKRLCEIASFSNISKLIRVHVIEGGTHNECWIQGGQAYWVAIRLFIKEALEVQVKHHHPTHREKIVEITSNRAEQQVSKDGSAIPTIPSNFFGIAKEAAAHNSKGDMNDKKIE